MSRLLLAALALATYGSRVLGLLAVPHLTGWLRDVLERLPAPLFAGLAAAALLTDGALATTPVLAAAAGAVAAVLWRRTLLVALLGGLLAYGLTILLT